MPLLGEISALLTAIVWSGSAFLFAAATARVGSMQVNIVRLMLATVLLVVIIVVLQFDTRLSASQIMNLGISGVIGLAIGDTFLFRAFKEIGARMSMLIMSLAPAFSAVLAYAFLDEVISMWGIVGIVVTMAGIAMVVLEKDRSGSSRYLMTAVGVLYALVGALGQGGGLIFAKVAFMESDLNGFVATLVRIIASLILLLPVLLLTGRLRNPIPVFMKERRAFLFTSGGAVLGPVLGISFSLIAIAHTKVGIAATIMATVPILMLPIARFVTREHITGKSVVGAFITVAGVAILFLR
jgi:drug/metabolite transporter (DMT)-like permease